MPLLSELGSAVRSRRQEIGLTQQQLADLAELSRVTINALETGKLRDLSSNRIERLANELGFAVGLVGSRRPREGSALEAAARVASVPYAKSLPAGTLADALRQGAVPPGYIPQLRTLLQEAPVAVLAAVADELQQVDETPASETWKRMRLLATALKADRPLWQSRST